MRNIALIIVVAGLASAGPVRAAPPAPWPALGGLAFLVGDWRGERAPLPETGGSAAGRSRITVEAGGAALLRRDHTDLFGKDGRRTGGLDQIMLIYPEAGAVHADYFDGAHVIHYARAEVTPGRQVVFTSDAQAGAPVYRLTYSAREAGVMDVAFAMAPPGSQTFRPIAQGTLRRRL